MDKKGFDFGGEEFHWDKIMDAGLKYKGEVNNYRNILQEFEKKMVVILNVEKGNHWVLMTGTYLDNDVKVQDPKDEKKMYKTTEIVKAKIFERVKPMRVAGGGKDTRREEL